VAPDQAHCCWSHWGCLGGVRDDDMGGLGSNIDRLTESLISDLCKLGPDFFMDGKGEGGSKAKGDKKCSSSAPRHTVENPLRLLQ